MNTVVEVLSISDNLVLLDPPNLPETKSSPIVTPITSNTPNTPIKATWRKTLMIMMCLDAIYIVACIPILALNKYALYNDHSLYQFAMLWVTHVIVMVYAVGNIAQAVHFRRAVRNLDTQTRVDHFGNNVSEFVVVNNDRCTEVLHDVVTNLGFLLVASSIMGVFFGIVFLFASLNGCSVQYLSLWAFSVVTCVYIIYKFCKFVFLFFIEQVITDGVVME